MIGSFREGESFYDLRVARQAREAEINLHVTPVKRGRKSWRHGTSVKPGNNMRRDLSIQGMLDGNPAWEYQQAASAIHA
jgi:hypothetical protein